MILICVECVEKLCVCVYIYIYIYKNIYIYICICIYIYIYIYIVFKLHFLCTDKQVNVYLPIPKKTKQTTIAFLTINKCDFFIKIII